MSEHITSLIEERPLSELSEVELSTIRTHVSACAECRRGYEAAQISAVLLKERAGESFEPAPFFHTRVMATLRERQAANQPWAWKRVWQAAGALASSMVLTVAALAVFTFATPGTPEVGFPELATNNSSAEEIFFNQSEFADEQVSDSQILRTLYGPEEEAVK